MDNFVDQNLADLVSLADAALLAGVTQDTLKQYERYGLLTAIRSGQTDNSSFRRKDICSLFHVLEKVRHEKAQVEGAKAESSGTTEERIVKTEEVSAKPLAAAESREAAPGAEKQELLEINQLLRAQVQIIREERDWLRERVERLEARSEREQMLLLSESQTVRALLSKETKPRRWTLALPWFRSS